MDERRQTLGAAMRLAVIYSAVAALAAVALQSIGEVSTARFVIAVVVVGFSTSWVQTGRVSRAVSSSTAHRVDVTPLRQSIG